MCVLLLACLLLPASARRAAALPPQSQLIQDIAVTATTGEKPQSKVWKHAGQWWSVLPNESGTQLRRLDGQVWADVLQISASTTSQADVKVMGDVAHVFLFEGSNSELISLEYVEATNTYQPWSARPAAVDVALGSGAEVATIDIDSMGRMWVASDRNSSIRVRYSDPPYSAWSSSITVASGIRSDDIGMVVALPNGTIGVMWSNQSSKRFGFRVHVDGDDPTTWSDDELPASQSALNVGAGMADDHMNVAVASDGTLYAAVKTSYDTPGYPTIALLIRRPNGTWDDLYEVDQIGTRSIVLLDETVGSVSVAYATQIGFGPIVAKESSVDAIAFGMRDTVIGGLYNDVSSTKRNIVGDVVLVASAPSVSRGVYLSTPAPMVTLLAPTGGEVWLEGSMHEVAWSASDLVGVSTVDLDYSTVSGTAWIPIATGLANTGSYTWMVPNTPTTAARVRVTAHNAAGIFASDSSAADFEIAPALVSVDPFGFTALSLAPARPNPFASRTAIEYTLPRAAPVRLEIFDLAGRRVKSLADHMHEAGPHMVVWDGRTDTGLASVSGVYLVRLAFDGDVRVRKLILTR